MCTELSRTDFQPELMEKDFDHAPVYMELTMKDNYYLESIDNIEVKSLYDKDDESKSINFLISY